MIFENLLCQRCFHVHRTFHSTSFKSSYSVTPILDNHTLDIKIPIPVYSLPQEQLSLGYTERIKLHFLISLSNRGLSFGKCFMQHRLDVNVSNDDYNIMLGETFQWRTLDISGVIKGGSTDVAGHARTYFTRKCLPM